MKQPARIFVLTCAQVALLAPTRPALAAPQEPAASHPDEARWESLASDPLGFLEGGWIRVDDAHEHMVVDVRRRGTACEAEIVFATRVNRDYGFFATQMKWTEIRPGADRQFRLEDLTMWQTGVVGRFNASRGAAIAHVITPDELLIRQKVQNDLYIGEWQRWIRITARGDADQACYEHAMGQDLLRDGKREQATEMFTRAVERASDDPDYLNALAWRLAVNPPGAPFDPSRALKLSKRANELTGYSIHYQVDTLAAAHAATGNFAAALSWQQKACDLAPATASKEYLGRLEMYRAEVSFREHNGSGS